MASGSWISHRCQSRICVKNAVGVRARRVQEGSERSIIEVLSDYLRSRRFMLVLDNCEHLIAACARWPRHCCRRPPTCTSWQRAAKPSGFWAKACGAFLPCLYPTGRMQYPATRYSNVKRRGSFVERAKAAAPAFVVTDTNAGVVAEVCHRLDGIPLAIELAAARLNMLPVDQINDRLNNRFRLLTGGSRTALPRQRTLEATVDWSYDLLSRRNGGCSAGSRFSPAAGR